MGLCSRIVNTDGVLSTVQIHRRLDGGAPHAVSTGGGGQQRNVVHADEQLHALQANAVNGVKVVEAAAQFPCVATGCINAILEQKGDP